MKYFLLYFSFFLLFSCKEEKAFSILDKFPEPIIMKGKPYEKEIIAYNPSQIELIDSSLFLFGTMGWAAVIIHSDDASETGFFGAKGSGPDEFQFPFFLSQNTQDSTFYVEDMNQKSQKKVKWNKSGQRMNFKIIENKTYGDSPYTYSRGCKLANGYYIGRIWDNSDKLFVLEDKDLKLITTFGDLPVKEEVKNLKPFDGRFAIFGNRMVYATMYTGYIVCYEMDSDGNMNKVWEHHLTPHKYQKNNGDIKWDEKNLRGCHEIKMTSKYLYCLYSGEPHEKEDGYRPRTILIFTHDGTPVKRIKINKESGRFAVSPDDKTLYVVYTEPDVGIMRFDISDLLP